MNGSGEKLHHVAGSTLDLVVAGAGIVALARANGVARRHPDRSIVVLEKEPTVGDHQTGHNRGVIRCAIHYCPGTFKARRRPSPAATASLVIAEHLAAEVEGLAQP